ncbi:hypothetical protein DFH09DRAFT_1095358 [Mycena vulgaris]|nr:hypothetical protein DFH09DRAFT_1095358 [Mycena vulgaris]
MDGVRSERCTQGQPEPSADCGTRTHDADPHLRCSDRRIVPVDMFPPGLEPESHISRSDADATQIRLSWEWTGKKTTQPPVAAGLASHTRAGSASPASRGEFKLESADLGEKAARTGTHDANDGGFICVCVCEAAFRSGEHWTWTCANAVPAATSVIAAQTRRRRHRAEWFAWLVERGRAQARGGSMRVLRTWRVALELSVLRGGEKRAGGQRNWIADNDGQRNTKTQHRSTLTSAAASSGLHLTLRTKTRRRVWGCTEEAGA